MRLRIPPELKRIETEWYVITGAPCSGKTTIINHLKSTNYEIREEVGRGVLNSIQPEGPVSSKHKHMMQEIIISAREDIEEQAPCHQPIFFDRSLVDCITYNRLIGENPNDLVRRCSRYGYKKVFILDRLPYVSDSCRIESRMEVEKLDRWLEKDYRALGYAVKRISVDTIENRKAAILEEIRASD
ncbi:conserved protein of unknown function [Pseudodesulfovibrio profundus]|uniref:NadR/Ttd14 AAA domain-containing protein n=1 Tax=Pseudodesulfovibrio profundus TaxID=57320 RepID=A0A2C8FCH3_9BACT|nr:ATP-binding protein [Pseudodesulfovibrio profundus]SOB60484.1 conserved protein of unknown function [Pseudodesulfovibrio profundus]